MRLMFMTVSFAIGVFAAGCAFDPGGEPMGDDTGEGVGEFEALEPDNEMPEPGPDAAVPVPEPDARPELPDDEWDDHEGGGESGGGD